VLQDLKAEVSRLEKRVDELIDAEDDEAKEALEDIYERLEELDPATAPTRYC
jgi:nitrate reductase assembly molybdenum cofactor insertion protein NarJ